MQKKIIAYFKEKAPREEVLGYLELLLKEERVQKFRWKQDYVWRGTTELLV